jgi:hypothetical protein
VEKQQKLTLGAKLIEFLIYHSFSLFFSPNLCLGYRFLRLVDETDICQPKSLF